jgi:hypothetical protein
MIEIPSYTGNCPPGLVLGHAHLAEPAIERRVGLLNESLGTAPTADRN